MFEVRFRPFRRVMIAGMLAIAWLAALPATAQYGYDWYGNNNYSSSYNYGNYSSGYNYGQNYYGQNYSYPQSYSGYAPAVYGHDKSTYYVPEPPPMPKVEGNPPIQIFKSRRMGEFAGQQFNVSIGHSGNPTPTGRYTVQRKIVDYWSKKYDRAMPYSLFFTDAHAIHSGDLYTPSKGCIRVDRQVAMWLYSQATPGKTKVIVHP